MYKVIIADDEEIIREGLASALDWEAIGFQIVGKFEDGKDVIEYIKKYPVDVILTDIKMTFVSGIEVAKYIYENKLGIKVVLLSGFKEFEFAREAMRYNVVNYLLKPVPFKDVKKTFEELKFQLDKERKMRELQEEKQKQFEGVISISQQQFFVNVVMGALGDEKAILKRGELLNLKIDMYKSRCCLLNMELLDYDKYVQESWDYGKEGLTNAIRNFFTLNNKEIQFYIINIRNARFQILVMDEKGIEDVEFKQLISKHLEDIQKSMKMVLGLDCEIRIDKSFNNIIELALQSEPLVKKEIKSNNYNLNQGKTYEPTQENLIKLKEQQMLFVSHVIEEDIYMANRMYDRYIDELKSLEIEETKKYILELFKLLIEKLENNFNKSFEESLKASSIEDFKKLSNTSELRLWGRSILSLILKRIQCGVKGNSLNAISRVKEYVMENFNKDISLEDVAEHVFLSPVYLSRLFKEQTGENFSDYIINIKIEKSIELLKNPKYKVYEICNMVGYSNLKYFYRVFKKIKGCTPSEYRDKI